MATPTIASVSPTSGASGGRYIITIVGTNFRLPPVPPATGPSTPPNPSVRVSFIGSVRTVVARRVYVVSTSRMFVEAPAADPEVVAIKVENIDQNGVLIGSETATKPTAYTFKLPDLSIEGTLVRLVRTLLQDLKRQVLANTSLTIHTDFDETPADATNRIDFAKLPALVLIGPKFNTNRIYATNEARRVPDTSDASGQGFLELRPPTTVDLEFEILGGSESTFELLALMSEATRYFTRNIELTMAADEHDATKGTVSYEMEMPFTGVPAVTSRPNEDNVRQFSGTFIIRGVDLDDADMAILKGKKLADYVQTGADLAAVVPSAVIVGSTPTGPIGQGGQTAFDQPPPAGGIDFEQLE